MSKDRIDAKVDEVIRLGADSELTDEQRDPCYTAWVKHRDAAEVSLEAMDICDFRAGFMAGWDANENSSAPRVWSKLCERANNLETDIAQLQADKAELTKQRDAYKEAADSALYLMTTNKFTYDEKNETNSFITKLGERISELSADKAELEERVGKCEEALREIAHGTSSADEYQQCAINALADLAASVLADEKEKE